MRRKVLLTISDSLLTPTKPNHVLFLQYYGNTFKYVQYTKVLKQVGKNKKYPHTNKVGLESHRGGPEAEISCKNGDIYLHGA